MRTILTSGTKGRALLKIKFNGKVVAKKYIGSEGLLKGNYPDVRLAVENAEDVPLSQLMIDLEDLLQETLDRIEDNLPMEYERVRRLRISKGE